jgi:WhiB family redox-sensing transcriptional regulator
MRRRGRGIGTGNLEVNDPMSTIIADRPVSFTLPGMVAETVRQGQPACTAPGVDPAWFYPEPGDTETTAYARRICLACPLRPECLEYALEHDERWGVWGGLAEDERPRPLVGRPRPCRRCGRPAACRRRYCGDTCASAARAASRRRAELRRRFTTARAS